MIALARQKKANCHPGSHDSNPNAKILLAVMVSLKNHGDALNRIKQKSLESKIVRMKEAKALSAHQQELLAAFSI